MPDTAPIETPWIDVDRPRVELLPVGEDRCYLHCARPAAAAERDRASSGAALQCRLLALGEGGPAIESSFFPSGPSEGWFATLESPELDHVALLGRETSDGSFDEVARSDRLRSWIPKAVDGAALPVRVDVGESGLTVGAPPERERPSGRYRDRGARPAGTSSSGGEGG